MPVVDDVGSSEFTKQKEAGLDRILSVHLPIVSSIIKRPWPHPEYHWIDINAGPGENPDCPGSPAVFLSAANRLGVNYKAWFIEQNERHVAKLAECIGHDPRTEIRHGDHRELLPRICGQWNGRRQRYGMIYTDPNGPPNFDTLADVSRFPTTEKIDMLIHVAATAIKRVKQYTGKSLIEHIALIKKKCWIVRDASGTGPYQWTFLLGTNWEAYPDYRSQGFYRTDSKDGKEILYILSTTEEERHADMQPPLFQLPVQDL